MREDYWKKLLLATRMGNAWYFVSFMKWEVV